MEINQDKIKQIADYALKQSMKNEKQHFKRRNSVYQKTE
ncbi:hypothetical protein O1Q81_01259 [Lonepinella sp. MS14436]